MITAMEHSRSIVSLGVEVYLDERSKGYATAAMKQAFMLISIRKVPWDDITQGKT